MSERHDRPDCIPSAGKHVTWILLGGRPRTQNTSRRRGKLLRRMEIRTLKDTDGPAVTNLPTAAHEDAALSLARLRKEGDNPES